MMRLGRASNLNLLLPRCERAISPRFRATRLQGRAGLQTVRRVGSQTVRRIGMRASINGSLPNRIPFWLDCDPGHDDALAIILAGYHPKAELLGISTVFGNQSLEKVTKNACLVLHAAGLHNTDVYAGQSRPLMRHTMNARCIHGESGLDMSAGENGELIIDPSKILSEKQEWKNGKKALFAMHDTVMENLKKDPTQPVYIVCTAALTNMAMFLTLYPELIPSIKVVCMGGTTGIGNFGRVTEFNFQIDPEAAKIVFQSGVDLTMIPLDVTHTVLATEDVCNRIYSDEHRSDFRLFIRQILTFYAKTYKDVYQFDTAPIHDPCAVLCALDPELFKLDYLNVEIETISPLSTGQSICDVYRQFNSPPNCYVGKEMNVPEFWNAMIAAVDAADQRSPLNKQIQTS